MARGILYVMSTIVPGLIKIGKTGINSFEQRMYSLEHNGYSNVTGLSREFAIEVDDYDEKEVLLDEIFSKSRIENTELFALDLDLIVQLLSSFEGTQIYPEIATKEEVFDAANANREEKSGGIHYGNTLPDGFYYLKSRRKNFGIVKATMEIRNGKFIVKKGSTCAPVTSDRIPKLRESAKIVNNILQEDVICNSPSTAGFIVLGKENNGWIVWKDKENNPLEKIRHQSD